VVTEDPVTPLDALLADTAAAGAAPVLADLVGHLDPTEVSPAMTSSAAGPFAHLLCQAAIRDLAASGAVPEGPLTALLSGLARQRRLLPLLDAIDVLLADPPFVDRYGDRLCAALLMGRDMALRAGRPLTATGFVEGALRLALIGMGSPLLVLDRLCRYRPGSQPVDYLERLPRLVGAALDQWGGEETIGRELRATLVALQDLPEASADATFELALDILRQAVGASRMEAPTLLVAARQRLASVEAADERRDDAALYGAGIDAVIAFLRGDGAALRDAGDSVRGLLDGRLATFRGSHLPPWRDQRHAVEPAWSRLALILDRAHDRSAEPVWLDAWAALDAILDAYVLDRSVVPVVGKLDRDGLAQVLRPALDAALVRREALLAQVRQATLAAERNHGHSARLPQLRILMANLDAMASTNQRPPDGDPDTCGTELLERLVTIAPALRANLGDDAASRIAARLDDEALRLVEGVAYNASVTRSLTTEPVIDRMLRGLSEELQASPDYAGTTRRNFDLLLHELVCFLATRHDLDRSGGVGYLRAANPPPREALLQDDFADWLRRGSLAGRIDVEVPNVATGRVDIKVGFGTTRFYVEVKRERRDASNAALERGYAMQAADYAGTSATLGILLVLDLTAHPDGVRHLSECAWATRHRPSHSTIDRHIVVGVVIGNRATPSAYSRAGRHGGPTGTPGH
jgi:hypothetical protein